MKHPYLAHPCGSSTGVSKPEANRTGALLSRALRSAMAQTWRSLGLPALPTFGRACLLAVGALSCTSTSAANAEPARRPDTSLVSPDEQCRLRELRLAQPESTVAELEARCPSTDQSGKDAQPTFLKELLSKPENERSLFERRVLSEMTAMSQPFSLLPHRPNFVLPLSYHRREDATQASSGAYQSLETQFQISFKFPVSRPLFGGLVTPFFAYSSRSWWQVYDGTRSRPFRENNYEPEFFLAIPAPNVDLLGWRSRVLLVGFNHQSNGRSVPESRSWNRLVAELMIDRGTENWASLKVWHRLKEDPKKQPTDSEGDDNPGITRYLGHFEAKLGQVSSSGNNLTLTARHSFRGKSKGALQFDWSRPVPQSPALRWYVVAFVGYGDSLIDYNNKVNRVGLGVTINDWF